MYYLRDGLRSRWLARAIYALVAGVAALTTTPFTQTNSIALVLARRRECRRGCPASSIGRADMARDHRRHQVDRTCGREAHAAQGRTLSGRRVSSSCPFASHIPEVLALVVREAFSTRARRRAVALGHSSSPCGTVSRAAIYANEAGYGTAAVAYGTAQSREPRQQGLNAVVEVFIVSFVTSTISALSILLTGAYLSGQDEHGRRGARVRRGDARRRRLDGRGLRVPLRVHDAHRLVVLRRAVPRVSLRSAEW